MRTGISTWNPNKAKPKIGRASFIFKIILGEIFIGRKYNQEILSKKFFIFMILSQSTYYSWDGTETKYNKETLKRRLAMSVMEFYMNTLP